MVDLNSFATLFPFGEKFAYPAPLRQAIEGRRQILDGSLFIDQLFDQLNITADSKSSSQSSLYPPATHDALVILHDNVTKARIAAHHKHCIFYYLLLDLESTNVAASTSQSSTRRGRISNESSTFADPKGSTIAECFASNTHLPRKYRLAIEGLWAMDHGRYRVGCEALSQPALLPTFPEKVLSTLLKAATASSPEKSYALSGSSQEEVRAMTLAYWHSKSSHVSNDEALMTSMFEFLACKSIRDGYELLKTRREGQNEAQRRALFQRLIGIALDPENSHANSGESQTAMRRSTRTGRAHGRSASRQLSQLSSNGNAGTGTSRHAADAGLALVDLPLTEEEEHWLETYLTIEDGQHLPHGADLLRLRLIVNNKVQRSISSQDVDAVEHGGNFNWGSFNAGLNGRLDANIAGSIREYDWSS